MTEYFCVYPFFFFFNDTAPTEIYTLSLHDALPIRATFYYPWFPEGWKQQGMNPFTRFHPTLGSYDLNSAQVLAAHIKALRYAGQQAGIASWWGAGAVTDRHLGQLLRATAGQQFRWSVYHEGEGQAD